NFGFKELVLRFAANSFGIRKVPCWLVKDLLRIVSLTGRRLSYAFGSFLPRLLKGDFMQICKHFTASFFGWKWVLFTIGRSA
uniref:Uncharacterized protein n=1 Tax=Megaselia scalaris TaxID=36166 RepID=T1GBW7_MEGSC